MSALQPVSLNPQPSTLDLLQGLRVCLIAGTLGQGGAERQLFYMLQCLKECGAEVNLLSLTQGEYWEAPIQRLGVPIYFVGGPGTRLRRLRCVIQTVRRLRPQVIQCQHFYTNLYGALAARWLGLPSVGGVRSDGFNELKSNGRFFGRLSLTLPQMVAANSNRAIENLRSIGCDPRKLHLLPNVIDTAWFHPGERSRSRDDFVILGVGSLEPVKRFDRLIEIALTLRSKIQRGVRVVLAGDGRLRQLIAGLAHQAREQGVKVDLVGRVTDPLALLQLYQSADVLLLTSDHEGTPNVIMEAMSCGLPVVATAVGGVADLVQPGEAGFLFAPDQAEQAVAALVQLAREPSLASGLGARARSLIEAKYSVALLPNLLAGLYEKALAPSPSP